MLKMNTSRKRIKKIIRSAMSKLNEEDYTILNDLFFKNISIHQLSKKLGISRPAVRYRRDKALKKLKEIFNKNYNHINFNIFIF